MMMNNMRDAKLIQDQPLERGGEEFRIGNVYVTCNNEFYVELKKGNTTMNMRIQELKEELNSGKTKLMEPVNEF
jgi:hypothetical protein